MLLWTKSSRVRKNSNAKGEYKIEGDEWDGISSQAKQLISKMICSQNDRINASQVLQHPWMQQNILNSNIKLNVNGIKNFY